MPSADAYRYDRVQRAFHWSMAGIVLVAVAIGLVEIHNSLGMLALVLLPLRAAWRLVRGEPAWREKLSKHVHRAALAAHVGLYGLLLAMPLSGYVNSGAGGYSLPFFGLFQWPRLLPADKALSRAGYEFHHWLGWTLVALLAVHIGAALWHRRRGDEVFARMAP